MTLSYRWRLLLFFPILVQYVFAGSISQGPKSSWVLPVKVDPKGTVSEHQIDDGYYYLLFDKQVNVQASSFYYHVAQKIVNQSGVDNCSKIDFTYDKAFESVVVHEVRVLRGEKSMNKLNMSQLKEIQQAESLDDSQYDERMSGYLFLEDIQAGDVIEYSYTRTTHNPLFPKYSDDLQTQFAVPVCLINYRVLVPPDRKLYFKSLNDAAMPEEKSTGVFKEYYWQLKDIKGLQSNEYLPAGYFPYPMVDISEYASWKELAKWATDLYEPMATCGPGVKVKSAEIKAQYSNDEDRIIASLRFVQDNIRYLGMETGVNTHKPHAPEQVLKQAFGDCKDKALLLCCLLREMGITAYPMLINSNGSALLSEYLPSPFNFDHVCVAVEYNGSNYYFDPTISYQRGTLKSTYFPKYNYGFIVNRNSEGLVKLPHDATSSTTRLFHRIDIPDTMSAAKLEVLTSYTGCDADNIRRQFANNSLQSVQQSYLDFYIGAFKEVDVIDSVIILSDDATENKVTTRELYSIPHIWSYHGDKNQWKLEFFAYNLNSLLNKTNDRKRTMPLRITYPRNYSEIYEIKLGDDWQIDKETKTIENSGVIYTSNKFFEKATNTLHLDFSLVSKSDRVEAADSKKYFADLESITDDLGYALYYNLSVMEASSFPYSIPMILIFMVTIGLAGYGAFKIHSGYDIITEFTNQEPRAFGGWLLIPFIGVVLSPFLLAYTLYNGNFFPETVNDILFNRHSTVYSPSLGAIIIIELIMNGLILTTSVLAFVLMFQKRSIFPRVYITMLALSLVIQLFDLIALNTHPVLVERGVSDSGRDFARTLIGCVVWIPYMLSSYRVKETFTRLSFPIQKSEETTTLPTEEVPATTEEEPAQIAEIQTASETQE